MQHLHLIARHLHLNPPPAVELANPASGLTVLDTLQVKREIAENGFFILPAGSTVNLHVGAISRLQRSYGSRGIGLGIVVSQAPIECTVNFTREPLSPDDPKAFWADLGLTSAELRRLQTNAREIDAQLQAQLPKLPAGERESLATLIGGSEDPVAAKELSDQHQEAIALLEPEHQRLVKALLEANPDFQKLVDGQLPSHLDVTSASLHVGTTFTPYEPKSAPPPPQPAPAPVP